MSQVADGDGWALPYLDWRLHCIPSSEGDGPFAQLSCQLLADLVNKHPLRWPLVTLGRFLGRGCPGLWDWWGAHSLSHRILALRALSCSTVGHWLATMLLTPTRLRRMAVLRGLSKDCCTMLWGAQIPWAGAKGSS